MSPWACLSHFRVCTYLERILIFSSRLGVFIRCKVDQLASDNHSYDVVIVGGGVAGLCAAIAAHDEGAKTLLLEASSTLGGTAAWSGGAAWFPVNRHLQEAGGNDSREAALTYMRTCAEGKADEAVFTAYLDAVAPVMDYLEENTPLKFEVGTMPDYQGGLEGGFYQPGISRSVCPEVFSLNRLGDGLELYRQVPSYEGAMSMPLTFQETARMKDGSIPPEQIQAMFKERLEGNYVGMGAALTAALLLGVLERDINLKVNARARHLQGENRVTAVEVEIETGIEVITASAGVIICSGGYEFDDELVERNFPGVKFYSATLPSNRGDGFRMAEDRGAEIGNEGVCWGWPAYIIPGEELEEGGPIVRSGLTERALPHMIVVNSKGQRFVDETLPYHSILKDLIKRDGSGEFANMPAYHLFDQQFRDKYSFGPIRPGEPAPDWVNCLQSVEELAGALGIDAANLEQTLDQYNADVEKGVDSQFHRGEAPYGLFWGDTSNKPTPNLGTVAKPPFYAVQMLPSNIGTCGGPKVSPEGEVLNKDGKAIPGLYAAGNVTAGFSGSSYFGPGATIGPAMVFGVLAARTAVAASRCG